MKKRSLLLSLLVAVVVLVWWLRREDQAVAELQARRNELFARAAQMTEQERIDARNQMRQQVEQLSSWQKRAFFTSTRAWMISQVSARLDQFHALPPDQQQRQLDEHVQMILSGEQPKFGPGPPPGVGRRDGGPPAGGGPGREGWGDATPEQREARRKQRLDFTNPKLRTQFTEYRRRLNEKLEAAGAPPVEGRAGLPPLFRNKG